MENKQNHWDSIYDTKRSTEVSWYEPVPETSLDFITECKLDKDAAIIDIGSGDSSLAASLSSRGYTDITVLDISEKAIKRAQERMGSSAEEIKFIVADVLNFLPEKKYDLWHDRAAFHFLTNDEEVEKYMETLRKSLKPGGFVVMSTFSKSGPDACSGLEIRKYAITDLISLFAKEFDMMSCKNVDHTTPAGVCQNFSFCSFKKK